MSAGAMSTGCGLSTLYPKTISPLGCGGSWWRLPRMGTCATVMCQPRSATRRIYYIYIHARMTGLARYAAPTARDQAKHLRGLVPCALCALLSQLTRALRSFLGEGGGRP